MGVATEISPMDLANCLFPGIEDAAVLIDSDALRIVDANSVATRLFGRSAESLRQLSVLDLLHDPTEHETELVAACRTGFVARIERSVAVRTDGCEFPVAVHVVHVQAGERPLAIVLFRNTAALNADPTRDAIVDALRDSDALYESLVETLPQCVFRKDREGRFNFVGRRFADWLKRSKEQILGKTDFDFFPPHLAEKYRSDDLHVMQSGLVMQKIEAHQVLGGAERHVEVVKTPVRDARGRIIGIQGIFWDITDRIVLEDQLRQLQKMEAVGQLAGGIAHDFNNLLTVIIGSTSLARELATDELRALLDDVSSAGQQAADLVRQLLTFSQRLPLARAPIDLHGVVEKVAKIARSTFDRRIDIAIRVDDNLPPVMGDPRHLEQVLLNLFINARDAIEADVSTSATHCAIGLDAELVSIDEDYCFINIHAKPGRWIRLKVSDTGGGMTDAARQHLFEPFFTTKDVGRGAGLGLAISYAIVRQHDGWIEAETSIGHGAAISVYLPAIGAVPLPNDDREADSDVALGAREMVLIVDDEEPVIRVAQRFLERNGYRTLTARDGLTALETFDRCGKEIDLVLMDLSMPRMSGQETLVELKKRDPRVRVVVMSGYNTGGAVDALRQLGATTFLAKPFHRPDLLNTVREALDSRATLALV